MWLTQSSIGRKVIMSVTGIALILFLTFHGCMNLVALFSRDAYNTICEMLGANWYAVAATVGLGALVVLHFVYAFILTLQNRRARGASRYAVTDRPGKVEWASQNMFVLGVIVVLGLLLHLWDFWYNMMFQELIDHNAIYNNPSPTDGIAWMEATFANPVNTVLYLIWFAAIWFHLTHGFWSALQTMGWNGKTWFCRWKVIGIAYTTLLILGFLVVVLWFAAKAWCCGACC